MTLLLATALPFEARDLAERLGGDRIVTGRGWRWRGDLGGGPVELVVTGPGARRVHAAADALATPPRAMISSGVAGALRDDLEPGDVVVADSVATFHSSPRRTDDGFRAAAETALGAAGVAWRRERCLGVDEVLASEASKRDAAGQSGAAIVQMEDHVWAERAAAWRVPFLSLRVVLDAVDREVPEAAMRFPWRGPGPLDVLRVVAACPAQIPALIALGRAQSQARRALAAAQAAVLARCAAFPESG